MSASMRVQWGEPGPERRSILAHLWMRFESLHDLMFADASKLTLKHLAIALSIAGFAIHLGLIFLAQTLAHPPRLIALAGQNYLAAISTPFNFILFYEVLTLIAALPTSTTRSIANQFEIVSLIFIRDVFKDIATATDLVNRHRLTREALPVFFDMWAGFLMFFLVAVFRLVAQHRWEATRAAAPTRGSARFMAQKRWWLWGWQHCCPRWPHITSLSSR